MLVFRKQQERLLVGSLGSGEVGQIAGCRDFLNKRHKSLSILDSLRFSVFARKYKKTDIAAGLFYFKEPYFFIIGSTILLCIFPPW